MDNEYESRRQTQKIALDPQHPLRPELLEVTLENVEELFKYAPWSEAQIGAGNEVRAALVDAAKAILRCIPRCPLRSRALNNLVDARMLANAAITHHGVLAQEI